MNPPMTPLMANGIAIIRCLKYTGIIILAAPIINTKFTPAPFTLIEPNKNVTHAATIPIFAAPLPKPDKLIAVAMATKDIGVTINKAYVTNIKINIINRLYSIIALYILPIYLMTYVN